MDSDAAYQPANSANSLTRQANPEKIEQYENIMVFGVGGDKSGALDAITKDKLIGTLSLDEKMYARRIAECIMDIYAGNSARNI